MFLFDRVFSNCSGFVYLLKLFWFGKDIGRLRARAIVGVLVASGLQCATRYNMVNTSSVFTRIELDVRGEGIGSKWLLLFVQPLVQLSAYRRSVMSVRNLGPNIAALWKPDSSAIVVQVRELLDEIHRSGRPSPSSVKDRDHPRPICRHTSPHLGHSLRTDSYSCCEHANATNNQ